MGVGVGVGVADGLGFCVADVLADADDEDALVAGAAEVVWEATPLACGLAVSVAQPASGSSMRAATEAAMKRRAMGISLQIKTSTFRRITEDKAFPRNLTPPSMDANMSLPERRTASLPPAAPRWATGITRADVRVGDPEREAVVDLLGEHYAQGRLGHDDLELRTRTALAATTRGELQRVVADLPALPGQPTSAGPAIAPIVIAIVVASVMGGIALILGLVSLFAIPAGGGWGWLVAFLIAAVIAGGAGFFASRGLRARKAARASREVF